MFNSVYKILAMKKLKFWIYDLLNNRTNLPLLLLIPEMNVFFDEIDKCAKTFDFNSKIYGYISLIIFKYHFNLPFIRTDLMERNEDGLIEIHYSKTIGLFLLETRSILCVIHRIFDLDMSSYKLLIYKTFLSFVRVRHPKFINYFGINEFVDLNYDFNFNKLIELSNLKTINTEGTEQIYPKSLFYKTIDKIYNSFVDLENKEESETTKLEKFFNNLSKNTNQKVEFLDYNTNILKKITNVFKDLLNI